jgi:hypothetical protein
MFSSKIAYDDEEAKTSESPESSRLEDDVDGCETCRTLRPPLRYVQHKIGVQEILFGRRSLVVSEYKGPEFCKSDKGWISQWGAAP